MSSAPTTLLLAALRLRFNWWACVRCRRAYSTYRDKSGALRCLWCDR